MSRTRVILRTVLASALLLTLANRTVGAEKSRDWQMGKVLDTQRSRYFAGTVGDADTTGTAQANGSFGTYQGRTNTSQTAVYRVYETFLIEGQNTPILRRNASRGAGRNQQT